MESALRETGHLVISLQTKVILPEHINADLFPCVVTSIFLRGSEKILLFLSQ